MFPPSRIVCLTEETVEALYGEQDHIVGISGYVVRPPEARRGKPRVSAFTSANIDKILALKPDLVPTFSDLQADIAADLIGRGIEVDAFNQLTIAGIFDRNRTLGRDRGCKRTSSAARKKARNAFGRSPKPRGAAAEATRVFFCAASGRACS
jgi:iron complex transport system substrate-binding protein